VRHVQGRDALLEAAEPAPSVDSLRGLIRSVIEDFADRGDAVLVSHAASHALADRPDALRVLITAGSQTRRARVTAGRNVSEKDADKLIARGDANRADYIKRFYDVAAEQPTHYDIVLNTDRLGVEQAVDLIVQVASGETASAPVTEAPAT
jgi:cytidylate kinase